MDKRVLTLVAAVLWTQPVLDQESTTPNPTVECSRSSGRLSFKIERFESLRWTITIHEGPTSKAWTDAGSVGTGLPGRVFDEGEHHYPLWSDDHRVRR
jgi:hypothetical protein